MRTQHSYEFNLLPSFQLSLEKIGLEREPVLVIDGVLNDPVSLVEYAANEVQFTAAWRPHGGYPGVRSPAPLNYVNKLVRRLGPIIMRGFDLSGVKLARAQCNLSIVTLGPEQLSPLQRIPHVDTVDPLQFAILHYLCGEDHGGTAFYRHKATGFETLSPQRQQEYLASRDVEMAASEPSANYIAGDSEHYVQTAAFEAKFDRLLVYRSRAFHSGQITAGASLSSDPRRGRLTSNVFVNFALDA